MEAFVKKYTKLFLATLCFISSAPVLADGYKGEAPPLPCVTIPNFNGGFEFTLGAIYMRPTSSNLTYLGINTTSDVTIGGIDYTTESWSESSINPGYDWGFVLGLGYVFPNTANDVKLDWMYFHNNYSNSTNFGIPTTLIGTDADAVIFPVDTQDLDPGELFHASAKMEYDFDAVDLTFGQYVNIGPRLQTRLFAGLRYMRLNSDLSASTVTTLTDGDTGEITAFNYTNGSLNSSFNGLGPLFGIRADYYLGMGFGLSGAFDAALLVGDLSFSGNQRNLTTDEDAVVTSRTVNDLNWDSQNTVSPAFDGKFGLNYKYQFNNGTLVALELGYNVTKYIDVIEQIDRGGSTGSYYDTDVTNFGLNGPYLTLNVKV